MMLVCPPRSIRADGGREEGTVGLRQDLGNFTEWYADDTNPIVQRVLLSGRFHYDFATIDSDQGDNDEWNVRRLRIGPRITLFRKFTFHAELELDPQRHDPFYVRFTDLYLMWTKSPRFVLTVGKQSAPLRWTVRRHHENCSQSIGAISPTTSGFRRNTCPASASRGGAHNGSIARLFTRPAR